MLGVPKPEVEAGQVSGTLIALGKTLGEIGQTSVTTLAVAVAVLVTLVVFGRWIKAIPGGLVAVAGTIVVSYAFHLSSHGVATLGAVPSGLPHLGFPSGLSWSDVRGLAGASISMFLVIIAQSAATSRAYAVKYRERFDENKDLVGLSLANVAAGLSGTFAVNGSPTKTEMVDEAKSRTQVAQLTMAAAVALVLLFLTKPLQYLPEAVLSAVVFLIGIKLIDVAGMRAIWRLRRDEFWIAAATAAVVVGLGVEQGIILAIVLSVILHVRRHYMPIDTVVSLDDQGRPHQVAAEPGAVSEPGLVIYRFGVGLFYANASRLMEEATALVDVPDPPRWFVLLGEAMDDLDYTGGQTLAELADSLAARDITFAVAVVSDHLREELERFGVTERIGAGHIFPTVADAQAAFRADTARTG
jgi:MFS superfamily sulfate permease-like transporter